jgi:response regulator RpfG family c-di-GMP phosphodiesterase
VNPLSGTAILWLSIGICAFSTIAILFYSRIVMPRRLEERLRQSIQVFGTAIELRFPSHKGLTERVVVLATLVARKLNLEDRVLVTIQMAAELRDIGLCSIPYALVHEKSTYNWDEADWSTYYRHAEVSGAMLELVPSLRHLASIVRLHHANYRGTGTELFPSGDDIPIEARILNVVCEFVWLSRLQGSLLARDSIIRGRGTDFDPAVVDSLLEVLTSNGATRGREPAEALYR